MMDGSHFDDLLRALAQSRRSLLGGSLTLATGWLGLAETDARKKRKRKHKHTRKPKSEPNPEPNEYGCLNVGAVCESECCSGICEESQGKRTCKSHDVGGCSAGAQIAICGGTDISCTTSAGAAGVCGATTGNAGYCLAGAHCFACKTDVDCQEAFDGVFGPRAACIPCAECVNTAGTLCAIPFVPEKFSLDGLHGEIHIPPASN